MTLLAASCAHFTPAIFDRNIEDPCLQSSDISWEYIGRLFVLYSFKVYLRDKTVTSSPPTLAPLGIRFACNVIVTDSCLTAPAVSISETSSIEAVIKACAPRFSASRVAAEAGIFSPHTPRFWSSPTASLGSMISNCPFPERAVESRVPTFESGFLNSSDAWFCTTSMALTASACASPGNTAQKRIGNSFFISLLLRVVCFGHSPARRIDNRKSSVPCKGDTASSGTTSRPWNTTGRHGVDACVCTIPCFVFHSNLYWHG